MSAEKDPKAALRAATVRGAVLAINPSGDLVRLRPNSVRVTGDGLAGLKPGWRLATAADRAEKERAEKERAERPGGPSRKRSGA